MKYKTKTIMKQFRKSLKALLSDFHIITANNDNEQLHINLHMENLQVKC